MVRLEGLQENLSAGIFRIAMPVNWQYEHGTAGLDGNLFWLLPVFLRKIGFSLESSYRYFLMCIYAVSVVLSYVTFREAFHDRKTGIFGTMLYCWAPWYIDTLYGRAAIGEASGYAFLPVLLLFLVRAVGQREGKLPQSSFAVFIVGMLMLLFCCIYYRRQMLGRGTEHSEFIPCLPWGILEFWERSIFHWVWNGISIIMMHGCQRALWWILLKKKT